MISERLLTHVMDWQNRRQLRTRPYASPGCRAQLPGSKYMLYAHVPFCERLCPYCSFNRYPFHAGRARRYFSALRDELRMIADQGFDFESLYIGGGTPTAQLDELCATIDLARDLFSIKEVSTETNPNHLSAAYAEELAPRVHRLSVGVQSFDDGLLIQMDRYDKYGSGEWILQRLQDMAGVFDSLNVDLIFNFPSQTEEMLRRDVDLLKECGCNQATLYPLMASPAVARTLAGTVGDVDYGRERGFFDIVSDGLADTFEPTSAWSFSRIEGGMLDEYILDYEQYVGAGSGAFSFLQGGSVHRDVLAAGLPGGGGRRPHRREHVPAVPAPRPVPLPLPHGALRAAAGQETLPPGLRRQRGARAAAGDELHARQQRLRRRDGRPGDSHSERPLPAGGHDAGVLRGREPRPRPGEGRSLCPPSARCCSAMGR